MKWLKALLAAAVLLPCLGMLAIHLFFRIFHATDLTVEVVNQRAESVPAVLVEFGTRKCGPTDLVPSQSITCRYDRGKGGVEFLLGRTPRVRLIPNNYVMGGRSTAHRLTLEADGGATFQCLSGWCASDGGALDPVHVVPRTDTPSPPPPIAPDGGPSSPGSQPGADAGPAPSTVRGGDERRLSD